MATLTRRSLVSGAVAAAATTAARADDSNPPPVIYQSFQKNELRLRPYLGRNVALLLDPNRKASRGAIDRVLAASDRAWDWYKDMFERAPAPWHQHAGRATIAEVTGSCGAGCGQ